MWMKRARAVQRRIEARSRGRTARSREQRVCKMGHRRYATRDTIEYGGRDNRVEG